VKKLSLFSHLNINDMMTGISFLTLITSCNSNLIMEVEMVQVLLQTRIIQKALLETDYSSTLCRLASLTFNSSLNAGDRL
jgi:hypothetical protein